jgi:hypothetical protein
MHPRAQPGARGCMCVRDPGEGERGSRTALASSASKRVDISSTSERQGVPG